MTNKKNSNTQLKEYDKGWRAATAHHLLSAVAERVHMFAVDPNRAPKGIIFNKKSFLFVEAQGNSRATFYVNKEQKVSAQQWAFVFSTALIMLAFELYKKNKNPTVFAEKVNILYCANYVHNILNITEVPSAWAGYWELEQKLTFKNEKALHAQLKELPALHEHLFNFLSQEENFSVNNLTTNELGGTALLGAGNWSSLHSFNEVFAHNLIEQAQRTIELRSQINYSPEEQKKRAQVSHRAQRWFTTHYPLMAAVVASFEVVEDIDFCTRNAIEIGAVSASEKKIFINPKAGLSEEGMRFVIAHECLHIALAHTSRRAGRDALMWNLACDFVINHWLVEMRVGLPPPGVFLDPDLAGLSADEIYMLIAKDVRLRKRMMTLRNKNAGANYEDKGPGGGVSKNTYKGKNNKSCDMLDEDARYYGSFEEACAKALLRGYFMHESIGRGSVPAGLEEEIKLVNQPPIEWQVELARWINERFPLPERKRTYSRLSRRQSSTPDIPRPCLVRPEEEKHTRTFGVIMDTSLSMDKDLLGKCLGAITAYASAQEVKYVRLVYCDAQAYDEGYVDIDTLMNKVKVKGRGGTVLQKAVNFLENTSDFPKNAPILILTDGYCEDNLKINRDHAFLVPDRHVLGAPYGTTVFEFK